MTVTLTDGSTVTGDELLVAVGRTPQTEGLGLESIGLEPDGFVEVDAHMQVPGHEWLYVIGDLNGRAQFTHMAKYQARIAADHVLGRDTAAQHGADGPLAPRVIFTDPQVAAVGPHDGDRRAGRAGAARRGGRDVGQRRRLVTTAAARAARAGCWSTRSAA